jgi:hypothetical protein
VPIDEWISKMWSVYILECYSALKRKEILIHATTWMKLENTIMLSKISQLNTRPVSSDSTYIR